MDTFPIRFPLHESCQGGEVYINGTLLPKPLSLNNTSLNGICCVRFRSTAKEEDLAGWLVEHIKAKVVWE